MADGPTKGAGEAGPRTWSSRPWLARALKAITILLPIGAAVALTTLAGPYLARPAGLFGDVVWMIQLAALSAATVIVVDRFARRLVPLSGLLSLSMVFPDEAPSRFGLALKAGTTKRLRAELDERPSDETVNDAATRLLAMVTELNNHDRLTRGHTERVRAYTDLIAEEMGLEGDDRWKLRWAVLLHDIGKLSVPPEILNSPGKPTDEQWAVLRNHPAAGAELVQPLAEWLGDWRLAAGQHHERWDGNGYPNGLAGEQISLAGRIVAVADAYDVITSARSYKRPTDPAVAREELVRCAGTQFDPQVVRAFVNVSLGRLRLVGGPLAWLASLPALGNVPSTVIAAATNAAVAASVVAATVVGGLSAMPASSEHQLVQTAAASVTPGASQGRRADRAGKPGAHSGSANQSGSSRTGSSATGSGGAKSAGDDDDGSTVSSPDGGGTESATPGAADSDPTSTTIGSSAGSGDDSGSDDGGGGGDSTASSGGSGPTTTTTLAHGATTTVPPVTTTSHATTTTHPTTTTAPHVTTTTVVVGPTAHPDTLSVSTLVQGSVNVVQNDVAGTYPLDGSTLKITSGPSHASSYSVQSGTTILYKSTALYIGSDSLQYQVCDTSGRCSSATVAISVGLL